jgi:hypothetical protein
MTPFSQRDPRWSRNGLGDSALTIGEAGCLITAIASMLTDWNVATDPARLNRWLRNNAGYHNGALFRFASVAGLGADLVELVPCPRTPAPIPGIVHALHTGRAVIAEVNARPGKPHSSHWIRLLPPIDDASRFHVMDPWRDPGDELTTLPPAYALTGWDPARILTCVAVYQHNTARVIPFALAAAAAGPTQIAHAIHTSPAME